MAKMTLAELADAPKLTPKQRARLDAMSQDQIDAAAYADPINPAWSDERLDRAVFARSVRQAREKAGLTQAVFAERFHIALARLRDWEQGRYNPDTVAVAYIKTILHDPKLVARALEASEG